MTIEILVSAKNDLDEGYWFYERQQEGLGPYFRSSVGADIELDTYRYFLVDCSRC